MILKPADPPPGLPLSARRVVPVLIILAGCGCGAGGDGTAGGAAPAGRGTVATIGDTALPYEEFQRYLDVNAGQEKFDGQDEIMSSLLDQFLEEQVMLQAGSDLGVAVSEAEIDAYLGEIGATGEEEGNESGAVDPERFRAAVRDGLLLQKLKDQAVLSKIEVGDGEVDEYLKNHPDMLRRSRTLVLRHLLVEDRPKADRLRQELVANPDRFEEVAREHSAAPDGGQAKAYSEEQLPEAVVEPILALKPGEVSPVLELAQSYLIFQLVRKDESSPLDRDEVRGRVRLELYQQKVDQVLAQYIADLKKNAIIHVNRSILPFNYLGEHRN